LFFLALISEDQILVLSDSREIPGQKHIVTRCSEALVLLSLLFVFSSLYASFLFLFFFLLPSFLSSSFSLSFLFNSSQGAEYQKNKKMDHPQIFCFGLIFQRA
jgi:hypothetical protein